MEEKEDEQQKQQRAVRLLREQLGQNDTDTAHFIVHVVLQDYLRPLFSRSRPATVTASGHKAAFPDHDADRLAGPAAGDERERELKPWKLVDWRAVPVFEWTVNMADDQLVATHWALFTPPLLTLLDDTTADFRRRGLVLLPRFLTKLPDQTLRQTGLASVFEDAVFPTLSYLPRLTPEPESVALLEPAFEALLCLARKLGPPAAAAAAASSPLGKAGDKAKASNTDVRSLLAVGKGSEGRADSHGPNPKTKLLDRMMRDGIGMAFFHAREYVRIVELLCVQSEKIVAEMGLGAVKHLKDLVPMYCTILADPFAPLAPDSLIAAIRALQTLLTTCWPRLARGVWRDEVIRALMLCWLAVASEDGSASSEREKNRAKDDGRNDGEKTPASFSSSATILIRKELTTTARLLDAAMRSTAGAGEGLAEVAAPLVARDVSLSRLFGATEWSGPAIP